LGGVPHPKNAEMAFFEEAIEGAKQGGRGGGKISI
jgi:hypothetical protein